MPVGGHPVDAHARPHGSEAAEHLVPGVLVAAVHALRGGGGKEERQVVARLTVARGEDLPGRGFAQEPLQRAVAHPAHVRRDAGPVEVHVRGQRGRRRPVGKPALLPANLGEAAAQPAQFLRDGHLEIAGLAELFEVLAEEPVLLVVTRGPLAEASEHVLRQDLSGHGRCHGVSSIPECGMPFTVSPKYAFARVRRCSAL